MKQKHSMFDSVRPGMRFYSLEEQVEILQRGIYLMQEWTGRRPIAHRSGGYHLNQDTITALSRVGIRLDSSMFHGHRNVELCWSRNALRLKDGILELPVTNYQMTPRFRFGPLSRQGKTAVVKTQADYCQLRELLQFVEFARRSGTRFVNLFLHSYSFLRFDKSFTHFEPDYAELATFDRYLSALTARGDVRQLTMVEFLEELDAGRLPLAVEDDAPSFTRSYGPVSAMKELWRKKRYG